MQSSERLSKEHNAVHALYRAFFTDPKDRHDLLLALEIGHTITIVENDKTKPLFAIGAMQQNLSPNTNLLWNGQTCLGAWDTIVFCRFAGTILSQPSYFGTN